MSATLAEPPAGREAKARLLLDVAMDIELAARAARSLALDFLAATPRPAALEGCATALSHISALEIPPTYGDNPTATSGEQPTLLERLEDLIAEQANVIQRARKSGRPEDAAAAERRLITLGKLRRRLTAAAGRLHVLKTYAESFLCEAAALNRFGRRIRMTRLRARAWWIRRQIAFYDWQLRVLCDRS